MELDYAKIGAKGFPQPIARVYLFQGSDDALKKEASEKLIAPLLDSDFIAFDREDWEVPSSGGESDIARRILASAAGAPMASARRVVVVTDIQRLSKEDQDILIAGLDKLGSLTCLVLIAGAPVYEAGKPKGGTSLPAKMVTALGKAGIIVLCEPPAGSDLKARAQAHIKTMGKTIEPGALETILKRSLSAMAEQGGGAKGGNLQVLLNELEKVAAYAGDRKQITQDDVAATVTHGTEENIFRLLDAVGFRDASQALWETDEVLRAGGKPDGVAARTIVMLHRHLHQVWGAKYLAQNRLTGYNIRNGVPADVQAALSGEMLALTQRHSFKLKSLQDQAKGWTDESLRRGLARILASDMALKSINPIPALHVNAAGADPASNLRLLVVDLCRQD